MLLGVDEGLKGAYLFGLGLGFWFRVGFRIQRFRGWDMGMGV